MGEVMIRVENLEKTYGTKIKTHALRGVSLVIPKGSFTCITGPSGHGKSTLLQLIGGLDRPTGGRVFIEETDIAAVSDNQLSAIRGTKIGFVFQFFNLLDHLTAVENIQTAMLFSRGGNAPKSHIKNLLNLVGLAEKANALPNELSGGQLQRLAIARALANDPPILLMDEPTGNLDSQSEADVLSHIFNIHKAGKTIVMVTHNPEIAKQAERVVEIYDGQLR